MDTVTATCPVCRAARPYSSSLIGRYTFCTNCNARFYVEVPPLERTQAAAPGLHAEVAGKTPTTLEDLLLDTRQGTKFVIQSLTRLESDMRTNRWLMFVLAVLGLTNLVGIVVLIVGRQ